MELLDKVTVAFSSWKAVRKTTEAQNLLLQLPPQGPIGARSPCSISAARKKVLRIKSSPGLECYFPIERGS